MIIYVDRILSKKQRQRVGVYDVPFRVEMMRVICRNDDASRASPISTRTQAQYALIAAGSNEDNKLILQVGRLRRSDRDCVMLVIYT